jgi:hypothetical protein
MKKRRMQETLQKSAEKEKFWQDYSYHEKLEEKRAEQIVHRMDKITDRDQKLFSVFAVSQTAKSPFLVAPANYAYQVLNN